jgi:chromosome partitioning protein
MAVIVAFVSKKGGVGKSTLARAFAAVCVRRGLPTTLADLDAEQQTATRWHRLRERNAIEPSLTVKSFPNVDAAIASEQDAEVLIVDAPGNAPKLTGEVASVAHLIVQPSGAGFDDLQPAIELFDDLAASGVPKSRLCVALSRILDPAEDQAARAYIQVAGFNVLPGVVVELARYRSAHNRGLAFSETPADLHASAGPLLNAVLNRVVQKLGTLRRDRAGQPAVPVPS